MTAQLHYALEQKWTILLFCSSCTNQHKRCRNNIKASADISLNLPAICLQRVNRNTEVRDLTTLIYQHIISDSLLDKAFITNIWTWCQKQRDNFSDAFLGFCFKKNSKQVDMRCSASVREGSSTSWRLGHVFSKIDHKILLSTINCSNLAGKINAAVWL